MLPKSTSQKRWRRMLLLLGTLKRPRLSATAKGLTYFEASAKDHESVDVVLRHTLHLGLVRAFLVLVLAVRTSTGTRTRTRTSYYYYYYYNYYYYYYYYTYYYYYSTTTATTSTSTTSTTSTTTTTVSVCVPLLHILFGKSVLSCGCQSLRSEACRDGQAGTKSDAFSLGPSIGPRPTA